MLRHLVIAMAVSSLATAQEKVTYDDQVLPVFQQSCLNCHNPDKTKGGLDLSSFVGAMKGGSAGKIVEPGDVGSILISSVEQTADPKMPPEGEKLAANQIQILKNWIAGGLLENKSSSVRKPGKPKFAASLRTDPAAKPEGPPPMPAHLLLDPPVVTTRSSAVRAIAASPWAPLIAVTGQRQVLLYHAESLELVGILPFPEGDPVSLAFTPDARYLIVAGGIPGKSGTTVTFDVTNGRRLLSAAREFDTILAADIRPGFDIVATGGPSRLLKLWNTESGSLLKSIKKHTDWITALDISPDGVLLASGDRNGGVWVWESGTGNEFLTLRGHQASITATAFRSDSNILATASEDGTLRFWEMNGGSEVRKIDAHPGGVTAFAFARDGTSLTAGRDFKAKLWKPDFTPARELARDLPALPTAAALDADGKRAFVGDARGIVLVFTTADAKPAGEIPTNPPTILARLATIEAQINTQEQLLTDAKSRLAGQTSALDAARIALGQAEKSHHQAIEIQKAAQAGAVQTPDDAHKKLAEDAAAHLAPAEQAVKNQRGALAAAEKSLADSSSARDAMLARLSALKAARKHWLAAGINTRALTARQLAESSALTTEKAQLDFTEAARKVANQIEILARKRHERDSLAASTASATWSPASLAELQATVTAIGIASDQELETLRNLETALEQLRDSIDPNAQLAQDKKLEAETLRQDYLKALE